MARRLYIGRLPQEANSDDLKGLFETYGRIVDVRVMTGFGFVEFEDARDAEDALEKTDGTSFQGSPILVQFAKENGSRRREREREPYENRDSDRGVRSRRPPGVRIVVSGLSRDTSWQDLKDFGREAGNVSFADIDRDAIGEGALEYLSRDDADRAVRELDGKTIRGREVKVALDERAGGVDNYKRRERDDYRRRSPPRRDDYRRRSRSRSPPRRRDPDHERHSRRDYDRRDRDDTERRDRDDRGPRR